MKKEEIEIEKKEEIEKEADEKPEEKTEDKPEERIEKPEKTVAERIEIEEQRLIELKKQREKLQEDKPEIDVEPRCDMKLVENEETGGVDVVYSGACGGKRIRDVAGKIALDGVRFRPETEEKPEEKKLSEMTKEERQKDYAEKVLACETAKTKMKELGIKPTLKKTLLR
ncbi:unnamed protein product [marine sediment metagenome]|uniref:Uncharacterized protein n=1 Tax=marine sediment metagenome TaxID=412755 RepID=X1PTQ9_9ZZZZ